MAVQLPKWVGYTNLSYEIPHIYKDPPKSKFTTKRDKVSEADVQWMTRPDSIYSDPTRINEAIKYLPRSIDPIAKVKYGSNPYKLDVIRPPERSAEYEIAISRPRIHQNKSVYTNPGLSEGRSGIDVGQYIDLYKVKDITDVQKTVAQVKPGAYYKVEYLDPTVFDIQPLNKVIQDNDLFYSASTNALFKIEDTKGFRPYAQSHLPEKIHYNVPRLLSRPIYDIVVPELDLMTKQDLKNIITNQIYKFNPISNENPDLQLCAKSNRFNVSGIPNALAATNNIVYDIDLEPKKVAHNSTSNPTGGYKVMEAQEHCLRPKSVAVESSTNLSSNSKDQVRFDHQLQSKETMIDVTSSANSIFKPQVVQEYNIFANKNTIKDLATNLNSTYSKDLEKAEVELQKKVSQQEVNLDRYRANIPLTKVRDEVQLKNAKKTRPMLELAMYQDVNNYTP
jgi:hypothetical protein